MTDEPQIKGKDLKLEELVPLKERDINLKTSRGYHRMRSSINALGLIEPLCVFPEDGHYVILDGFLRFKACQELQIPVVPCIVYDNKEAYTFNRMVNRLSGFQEMQMLRKSLETIEESTVAEVLGIRSISHRLASGLLKQLHPNVAIAFEDEILSRSCAKEFSYVLPDRQLEMLKEMRKCDDYSLKFARALVVGTADQMRSPDKRPRTSWNADPAKKKRLVVRLEEAERQHDFYSALYRRYSTDLLKVCFYVRKLITTETISAYLQVKYPELLANFNQIIFETQG
jgi:ParB family chromosome partitioning protein